MILKKDMFERMLSELPEEKRSIAESLIDNVMFMQHTLSELSEIVKAEGTIITRTNGNRVETISENPALKSYNNTIRNFSTTCRTLLQYLPEGEESDELMDFLKFCRKRPFETKNENLSTKSPPNQ